MLHTKLSGDAALLTKHAPKLLDISDMLLQRRQTAQRLNNTDPSFGMIRGEDESDEMFSWKEATSELPHISFSLEAWRGFRDLGPIWIALGTAQTDAKMLAKGTAFLFFWSFFFGGGWVGCLFLLFFNACHHSY